MKQIIKLTETDLHRIVKESVNKILREGANEEISSPKRKLEDAIDNVIGILHAYNEEDFEILTKNEFDNLYDLLSEVSHKIKDSYDYGPYEDDPYYFGN